MNATIVKDSNSHANILRVLSPTGDTIFATLDECFGLDRIRDWANRNRIIITNMEGVQ